MKNKSNGLFAALFLAVIGVVFLWRIVPEFVTSLMPATDFNELADEQITAGMHVKGDVYALLDSFASEQTWTENSDGSRSAKKTSKIYYVMPIGTQSYVGLECYAKDSKEHEALVNATYDWYTDETETINHDGIAFNGRIVKLDDELYGYLLEWFDDGETSEEELRQVVLPYMLAPFSPGMGAMMVIGCVILGIAILVLVVTLNNEKKRKKRAEELANMPAPAFDPTQADPNALGHLQQ